MKNTWILALVAVVIVVGGYLGRHKIKALLGLSATPVTITPPGSSFSSNTAPSNTIYKTHTDAAKGNYMIDFQGMTLYTYDKDTSGVSNCAGRCATAWPPYISVATAQDIMPEGITIIPRTDGSKQFAWKGMPLYYYGQDIKAGDTTGDGIDGVWHSIKL